ncbi:hypothetical protein AAE478_004384 [Parahypoxylon ruwenzoriense]
MPQPVRVAACHVSPVFLSAKATAAKAISLIQEAAQNEANLVVFPESYIPAFPLWSGLRAPTENHDLFKQMAVESVYVDDDKLSTIRATANQLGVLVSIGFSEKVRYSSATLFNSNLLIGTDGEILVHHRKLMPTFYEKLTWSPGDGHGLQAAETSFGKVGILICGENTNPLARYAMAAQGEQIHISTWPAVWPTRVPQSVLSALNGEPTRPTNGDEGTPPVSKAAQGANYDNVAANRTRAAAHCFEAKCFGVLCAGFLGADAISTAAKGASAPKLVSEALKHSSRGATMFLDPTGTLLPGFTVDPETSARTQKDMLQEEEGILYADFDLDDCIEGKQYHDVAGGYQRLDVFELKVDRRRRQPVLFE